MAERTALSSTAVLLSALTVAARADGNLRAEIQKSNFIAKL
jgi:hypothetical protein